MVQTTFSIEVADTTSAEGSPPIRRSILSPNALMTTPAEGVETLYDVLNYASTTFSDRKGFGYRQLQDTITTTKEITKVVDGVTVKENKSWTFFQLSEYHHFTYSESAEKTKNIGAGLRQLGLKKGNKVQISASTR
jgi:hypothetical protein